MKKNSHSSLGLDELRVYFYGRHNTMGVNGQYLLDTLKQAIEINSVLPHEEELAAFFADEIRSLGLEPEWQVLAPGRPNVYATADFGASDDMLLLTGHLDTVGVAANWKTNPFEAIESEGRLYGLGALDMKAGLVCALAAFKALLEDDRSHAKLGKVAFAATVDEEGLGIGARALLETDYGSSAGILLTEPTGGMAPFGVVPLGETGKVLYKLQVTGKTTHGFRPELGHNAIEAASKIVAALDKLPMRTHPVYGRGNYSTLKIEGGYKEYAIIVPESCEVVITRLTIPGESRDTAVADMRRLIDSLDLDCSVSIETPAPYYEPFLIDPESTFATSFRNAYQATLGSQPTFAFKRGISDANIYVTEGGIPTIVYGPNGRGIHECNEYVEIDSLVPVAQILADSCINYFQ